MAKVSLSVISIILILFVQGCHRQNTAKVQDSPYQSVDGEFAKIAGTWKSDDGLWEITISKDGKIASALIPMCVKELKPNHTTEVEMIDGGKSYFETGDFTLSYDETNNYMEVMLEITNIDVRLGENVVQGNTVYVYSGNLSNDSGGWDTQRTEVFDFGPRFPMNDPNNPDVTPVFFRKKAAQ